MSLAVKYRPQTLDEVVGQSAVITGIKKILARKNIPHTWLFSGIGGSGKTTLARILSRHFIGKDFTQANLIERDCAVENEAKDVRELTITVSHRAIGLSPIKCIILDEVHSLSTKGFDALLKSTEEPPDHVYWFLCSTNPSKLPETLKTRCVKFNLKPVSEVDLFDLIEKVSNQEKLNTLPEVLELIAETSKGSPREALSNLEKCAHAKSVNEAKELLNEPKNQKGIADLAKLLLSKRGKWADAIKILKDMENIEPETIRILITQYLSAVVMNAKSDESARYTLFLMECFSTPFNSSDKNGPLLLALGAAMGLGG